MELIVQTLNQKVKSVYGENWKERNETVLSV